MTLTWGALSRDLVDEWAALTNLLAEVDRTEEFYTAADLAEELTEPGVSPERDTVAAWQEGRLLAFGQVRVFAGLTDGHARTWLGGGVHPDFRGRGVGRRVMDRLERRGLELAGQRHPGAPITFEVSGGRDGDPVRPLVEHRGYRISRYYHLMRRTLEDADVPAPGPEVRPFSPELSEATRRAHNSAFATHPGSTPRSEQEWAGMVGAGTFRAEASRVIADRAGNVEAYVLAYQWVDGRLYLGQVGTIPTARGRGLARACLLGSLHAAADLGYSTAELNVDSANPSGAGRLYESVGFHLHATSAEYTRSVPSPDSGV